MKRVMMLLALTLAVQSGCTGAKMKRLSNTEFDHFYALRPYMNEDVQKSFLKLKTEEERNQYLKDKGLWDRFYSYDEDKREAIIGGEVEVGWTKEMVMMAWGAPYDRQKLVGRQATRSERLIYRFEQHEDGSVLVWESNSKTEYKATRLFQRDVTLDDDLVTELHDKSEWE